MARLFNGSSDTMQSSATVNLSGSSVLSITFWLWLDSYLNGDRLAFDFGDNSVHEFNHFTIDPDAGTGTWRVYAAGNAGLVQADLPSRPSAAAWHHFLILFDINQTTIANTIPHIYVDGVDQSLTVAGANTAGNFANATLYFMSRLTSSLFAAGRLAEVALYSGVQLAQNDATALSTGYRPIHVRPDKLSYYWPLLTKASPEIELVTANAATLTGTTTTDHPRIIY